MKISPVKLFPAPPTLAETKMLDFLRYNTLKSPLQEIIKNIQK